MRKFYIKHLLKKKVSVEFTPFYWWLRFTLSKALGFLHVRIGPFAIDIDW